VGRTRLVAIKKNVMYLTQGKGEQWGNYWDRSGFRGVRGGRTGKCQRGSGNVRSDRLHVDSKPSFVSRGGRGLTSNCLEIRAGGLRSLRKKEERGHRTDTQFTTKGKLPRSLGSALKIFHAQGCIVEGGGNREGTGGKI